MGRVSRIYLYTSLAVIMMPIGLAIASDLEVSALPPMTGVVVSSASFRTAFANGVSLMMYGAGEFRFGHLCKLGLPVTIWALIVAVVVVPPPIRSEPPWLGIPLRLGNLVE
jgi:di/tricarboxylate transporter